MKFTEVQLETAIIEPLKARWHPPYADKNPSHTDKHGCQAPRNGLPIQ